MKNKKTVIVVGGGAAGLMTAMQLSPKFKIIIIEKEKSIGRKLLVAGKGGFNLSNNCSLEPFISKYTPSSFLEQSIKLFSSNDLQLFLASLGIETYVGSSGRIFPKEGIKPNDVLKAFKTQLSKNGVQIKVNHKFISYSKNELIVANSNNVKASLFFDYCVFALGGASWSKTGSDGKWTALFQTKNINVIPFQASNCGVNIDWKASVLNHYEGKPLKNISFTVEGKTIKGEGLITSYGMEGNAIYPLIGNVRDLLHASSHAQLFIDLKPNNTHKDLMLKMKGKSFKDYKKTLNLSSLDMALLKAYTSKQDYLNVNTFISCLKKLELPIIGLRPLDEAISTVGGISTTAVNSDFSLKNNPNIFSIGEMLDWDAPTGGYLLQACFSMGYSVANTINKNS